jgi:8-oxo-dGTP diphosphatase
VQSVIRPTWRGTDEQRKLIDEVTVAIDHAVRVSQEAEEAIWEKARRAREAGVPDTQLCRITGLNRATLNRKLGPRPTGSQVADSDTRGNHVPEESRIPEHPPVVAAIVTSERGVLIGKRNDGKPPWTFIAGEIEPGESQADAAVREVKEETGLVIEPAPYEIGRRVHPKTGRTMIYLACTPVGKLDAIVGDEDELSEVKWASLAEAEELLPGLFEPVHEHLRQTLG